MHLFRLPPGLFADFAEKYACSMFTLHVFEGEIPRSWIISECQLWSVPGNAAKNEVANKSEGLRHHYNSV